jgi:hypothetical protein
MRFVLVECRGSNWLVPQWRATCATEEKTVDIFFFETNVERAREHVRRRYPNATFSDQETPDGV